MRKKLPPHWYFITYSYCPVCGGGQTYRERRFDPRPENPSDRYSYEDSYDWCDAL